MVLKAIEVKGVNPMKLVHVCTDVLPEAWRLLGVNARLTGVSLRDYLTLLILRSAPIAVSDTEARSMLDLIAKINRRASKVARADRVERHRERNERIDVLKNDGDEESESDGINADVWDQVAEPGIGTSRSDPLLNLILAGGRRTDRTSLPTAVQALDRLLQEAEHGHPESGTTIPGSEKESRSGERPSPADCQS